MSDPQAIPAQGRAAVLTKAVVRAAKLLGVTQKDLARTLGVSEAGVSRMIRGGRAIDPGTKEGELAILFVRVFRSLDSLIGGDERQARSWMQSSNRHLGGPPAELIQTVIGLAHVAGYLDAMRGKS